METLQKEYLMETELLRELKKLMIAWKYFNPSKVNLLME